MSNIELFQQLLEKNFIDAYIVFTQDFHKSEYVSDYFKGREFLSGFTGSAGTLLVLKNKAYLWTDGRYFIQAANQIDSNFITLMKMGEEKTPTLIEFLNSTLKDGNVLAFDSRCASTDFVLDLQSKMTSHIEYITDIDLLNDIWNDRPSLPFSTLYKLDPFFAGETYLNKLSKIKAKMKAYNANIHIISSLEDQAWLFNLRGLDVAHTPVFLAYTVILEDEVTLFVDQNKLDILVTNYLNENDITVRNYDDFYNFLKTIKEKNILLDFSRANYKIYSSLVDQNNLINKENPTILLKAIKNETEIENIKNAHIKDGVSMVKFMKYLKENYKKIELSEISVSDYLESLRKTNDGFIDLSFNTICGFKEHAAMMHYSANEKTNYNIDTDGMLLVDSGGHYLEGTTDITRTFAMGNISNEEKKHFTIVLKSVINLARAVFLKGSTGLNLDVLARAPIWNELIDYKCGTGHGVGYLLSVHEGPQSFRWKNNTTREPQELEPGMVITDEPGIYLENKYGIRTENELLVIPKAKNEFGEFYTFETITYCPIDLDCIDVTYLTKDEIDWLNNYHKTVFNLLSPYLNDEEVEWLSTYTRKI